jgi:hypothetical protein
MFGLRKGSTPRRKDAKRGMFLEKTNDETLATFFRFWFPHLSTLRLGVFALI